MAKRFPSTAGRIFLNGNIGRARQSDLTPIRSRLINKAMKIKIAVMAIMVATVIASADAGKIGPKQLPDGPSGIQGTSLVIDGKIGPKQRPNAIWTWLLSLIGK